MPKGGVQERLLKAFGMAFTCLSFYLFDNIRLTFCSGQGSLADLHTCSEFMIKLFVTEILGGSIK